MSTLYTKLDAPERARIIILLALASALARQYGLPSTADFLEDFMVKLAKGNA